VWIRHVNFKLGIFCGLSCYFLDKWIPSWIVPKIG
jgi:hypothetical protein